MNLQDAMTEWKKDAMFDEINLDKEIFKTPNLHAKYLEIYVEFKAKLAQAEKKLASLKFLKKKYYRGEMTREELEKHGWSQFQGLKMSASEMSVTFDMDPDISDLSERVNMCKTGVQTIEYILKQISQRDWAIRSVIDYRKYIGGN